MMNYKNQINKNDIDNNSCKNLVDKLKTNRLKTQNIDYNICFLGNGSSWRKLWEGDACNC